MDWSEFIINFIFAAIPTFVIAGVIAWRYNPYTSGSTIFAIASISAVVVGAVAGIWRSKFWETASSIGAHTHYVRKKKK